MELEGDRLQLLLQMAFGPRLAEGQAEWQNVPEVVRSSIMLMAKELRRLHRLVTANLQTPLQRDPDPNRIADLQAQVSHLKDQLMQDDAHHCRAKHKLSSLWGEVAAIAKATAEAQAQQAATIDRIESRWSTTETQLKILRTRMEEQDRRLRDKRSRTPSQQVDQALHELQRSQELCRQELRGLQRSLEATMQVRGVEVRAPERSAHLKDKVQDRAKKRDGAAHILLHQRYVEALKVNSNMRGKAS
ncbi:hypothetical protein V7S43_015432 [Phytophthora oleae]|uniref:Uncharacterized protein n=1 Tax=Phytophthora oleae TaxID=2107226 RepID=A0ABD3F233_9STRA